MYVFPVFAACFPQDAGGSGAAPTYSHEVNQGGEDDGVELLGGGYTREKLWEELIPAIQELDDPQGEWQQSLLFFSSISCVVLGD
jgi:hypothetical protein